MTNLLEFDIVIISNERRFYFMDILEILIAEECGVFDDLDKDKEEREEESK